MACTARTVILVAIVAAGSGLAPVGAAAAPPPSQPARLSPAPATLALHTATPGPSRVVETPPGAGAAPAPPSRYLRLGWPVDLNAPGAGFPYTPTLFDVDHDGADEIFLTGGDTFGLRGRRHLPARLADDGAPLHGLRHQRPEARPLGCGRRRRRGRRDPVVGA